MAIVDDEGTRVTPYRATRSPSEAIGWLCLLGGIALLVWVQRSFLYPLGDWLLRWWQPLASAALIFLGAAFLASSSARRRPPIPIAQQGRRASKTLSIRTIVLGAVIVGVTGIGAAVFLLNNYGSESSRYQLDAIRTAGTIVIGTGGAAALLLAARRQRSTELTLWHEMDVADSTEADAAERRITELYAKAVDQLGSPSAAVRLGGLYALERLAQSNLAQRQAIVNVICAYLRMGHYSDDDMGRGNGDGGTGRRRYAIADDSEVREAAQRILSAHLLGAAAQSDENVHWPDIDIDLTNARLVDMSLRNCQVRSVRMISALLFGTSDFAGLSVAGRAIFDNAEFEGLADFSSCSIPGASFMDVRFNGAARFGGSELQGGCRFDRARFEGRVAFTSAVVGGTALFSGCVFEQSAKFDSARFTDRAVFDKSTFAGLAEFDRASFGAFVSYSGVRFENQAQFSGATFGGRANFGRTRFAGPAKFRAANFKGPTTFVNARFHGEVNYRNAKFQEVATFASAELAGGSYFQGATFLQKLSFKRAQFLGGVHSFRGVRFGESGVNLIRTRFVGISSGMPSELVPHASATTVVVDLTDREDRVL